MIRRSNVTTTTTMSVDSNTILLYYRSGRFRFSRRVWEATTVIPRHVVRFHITYYILYIHSRPPPPEETAVQVLRDSLLPGPTVHPHTSVVNVPTYASGPENVRSFSRVYNNILMFWFVRFLRQCNNSIMTIVFSHRLSSTAIDNSPAIDGGW